MGKAAFLGIPVHSYINTADTDSFQPINLDGIGFPGASSYFGAMEATKRSIVMSLKVTRTLNVIYQRIQQ